MDTKTKERPADLESQSDSTLLGHIYEASASIATGYKQQWDAGVRLAQSEWYHSKRNLLLALSFSLLMVIVTAGLWVLCNVALGYGLWQLGLGVWGSIACLFIFNAAVIYATWLAIKACSSNIGFTHTWQAITSETEPLKEQDNDSQLATSQARE